MDGELALLVADFFVQYELPAVAAEPAWPGTGSMTVLIEIGAGVRRERDLTQLMTKTIKRTTKVPCKSWMMLKMTMQPGQHEWIRSRRNEGNQIDTCPFFLW